ncbi:GNAT family N-acetyltransferase [Microbacterium xylanilyticum]
MIQDPAVTLRPRTDADYDALYALAAELDTWEQRSPLRPAAMTRKGWEARVAEYDADPDGNLSFVVDVDGEAVGTVSLFDIDGFTATAEVGIALAAPARGRGIGSEAIRQIVEFGFVRANLRRLHLEVIASNAGAIRVYEKAGFVVEGRQREHAWVRGHYEDIVRMGLLRDEWRAALDAR